MIRRFSLAALAPIAGGLVLWLLFLPAADPASHRLVIDWRPQTALLVLLAVLGALALAGWRLKRWQRGVLAAAVGAAALLDLLDALVERFLDRGLDLYFDLRYVPSLLGLVADSAGTWRLAGILAAVAAALIAVLAAVYWSLGAVEHALLLRRRAAVSLGAAIAVLALPPLLPPVSNRALATAGREAVQAMRAWAATHGFDRHYAAALAAPQPRPGPLPGLKGRDVYLVYFESYGTAVLDKPAFRAAVAPALAEFESVTARAGYRLVSSRLVSPTFGGGSWLAHGTMASGVKLDALLSRLVLESDRRPLARYMAAAGYDTVNVMPGIKKPDPQAAYWGFARSYAAADLGYRGLAFGWFGIPDQYTLRRFAERELTPGHRPLFAQIVLVSSHTPFVPVPPYVADWDDAGPFKTVSQAEWARVYRQPDWSHLEQPYLDSVAYDLRTLAAWLARLDNDALVVILGDHQPPGFVSGASQPWTVPVYALSRDEDLVAPFRALGYVPGALPPPEPRAKGMDSFLGDFIAAYARPTALAAAPSGAAARAR